MSLWPKSTSIYEVGPRDGIQSEKATWTIAERVDLVRGLMQAGLKDIEVGSFVREDLLPQVAGTSEIILALKKEKSRTRSRLWAFVPNKVGLDNAIESGVDGVSFFVGVSDTFCKKNVNRSRAELLDALPPLLKEAKKKKLLSRVYVSTLVYCPYEGAVSPREVAKVVSILVKAGATQIVLSDTTGDANPRSLQNVLKLLVPKYGARKFALHLHDTRGLALANIMLGMKYGISNFDSSIGGMGGCPYAPGASGNLATEDLANLLLGMGVLKGVDLGQLSRVGHECEKILNRKLPAKILRTLESV